MRKNNKYFIRKAHRYLGLFIGIQFIFWTVSGLYFSWTNIDEIHGDHFRKELSKPSASKLIGLRQVDSSLQVNSLELRWILNEPYYWVNGKNLINAETGERKSNITKDEALAIASQHVREYPVKDVEFITEIGNHHEYRGGPLPAWVINYDVSQNLRAYISASNGSFQRVRHRDWRWFDFLWMTHVMDYESRDDINNWLLRSFSLLGLITVCSGFVLWYISSPTVRKLKSS